jgi:GDPmannose 4,6-dehydratase
MKILILGHKGQIASYLSKKLAQQNIQPYISQYGIDDYGGTEHIIREITPDIIFNFAAQSSVSQSFQDPLRTMKVNTEAVVNILEVIRKHMPETRFVQSSSAEIFGHNSDIKYEHTSLLQYDTPALHQMANVQSEITQVGPVNPYGISKLAAHEYIKFYREAYGIFAVSIISFNAESSKRPEKFFTGKLRQFVRGLRNGTITGQLEVGDISIQRDWSHAFDIAEGYWLAGNHYKPGDFVLGSGEAHSIEELIKGAFELIGKDYREYIKVNTKLFRPTDVKYMCADNTKAKKLLGWKPQYTFKTLIEEIING